MSHCRVFTLDSGTLAVDDPVQPVRNSDIIQLVHGMTERPLNRYVLRYSRCDWTTIDGIEQVCTQVLTAWLNDHWTGMYSGTHGVTEGLSSVYSIYGIYTSQCMTGRPTIELTAFNQ